MSNYGEKIYTGSLSLPAQSQDGWLYTKGNKIYKSNGEVHGLSLLEDEDYLDDVVEIVEHIGTKKDVYVLVSLWRDPGFTDLGWPTKKTNETLKVLTAMLARFPWVMFGICNEPAQNFDGSRDRKVWDAMNSAVNSIRSAEKAAGSAEHIIAVQGTGAWARNLQYYTEHPITAFGGRNIAYEVHVYDHQDVFNERFINPSKKLPVIIGEFGPADGYMTLDECQVMMEKAEELEIPYTGWSFHQRAAPSMLVDPTGRGAGKGMDLVPNDWGTLLKNQLAAEPGTREMGCERFPVGEIRRTLVFQIYSQELVGGIRPESDKLGR